MRCTSLILLFFLLLLASCERTDQPDQPKTIVKNEVIEDKISEEGKAAYFQFKELAKSETISEAFLFFTDPHLLGFNNMFNKNSLIASFDVAKELYDALPLNFCLCGGDWLNSYDTQEMAKEKLLFADRQMKTMFSPYYKMMGNHDTNYQGVVSATDSSRGDLPRDFIDKEYFSETGSAYYSFDGNNTRFYVLDSGLDWSRAMDDYRWEQIHWMANQLLTNQREHIAICTHMFFSGRTITPMSERIVELCDTYNSSQSITLQETEYDYSAAKGKIIFILSGHNHRDSLAYVGKNNNLPVIQTCNYTKEGKNNFDLCVVDYSKNFVDMIRVGNGKNRNIKMF